MVKLKKQTAIILILTLSLSLTPNFLYNKGRGVSAEITCPPGCEVIEKEGETYCINCPIECKFGTETVINKSCLPLEETGEWLCSREIPIGEVVDRSAILASKMLAEFSLIIENGQTMVDKTEEILHGNPGDPAKGIPPIPKIADWECDNMCAARCYKYFLIPDLLEPAGSDWELIEGPPDDCASGPQPPNIIGAKNECQEDASQCETCAQFLADESYCWKTTFAPDPLYPADTVTCKYCPLSCETKCYVFRCGGYRGKPGCCDRFFRPIIDGYNYIENNQKSLKNDIDEKYFDEEELKDLPDNFKFKRSYILEQLDFSRCELAQCWIPADEYQKVLDGELAGKHLLSCRSVSDMDLLEDDQLLCLAVQVVNEWEEIKELWSDLLEELEMAPWWQKPLIILRKIWETILSAGEFLFGLIKEWFNVGKEEGCYPNNYYCCYF